MSLVVNIVGFSVACVGVIGILNPRRLRELLSAGDVHARFQSAIVTRVILGGMLLGAAPGCAYPIVVAYLFLELFRCARRERRQRRAEAGARGFNRSADGVATRSSSSQAPPQCGA